MKNKIILGITVTYLFAIKDIKTNARHEQFIRVKTFDQIVLITKKNPVKKSSLLSMEKIFKIENNYYRGIFIEYKISD